MAGAGGRLRGPALRHRPPGTGARARTTSALALIALIAAAAIVLALSRDRPEPEDRSEGERDVLLWGLLVTFATAVVLSIPFAVSGRWVLLGVGFNNDLGLHLAWAEWLRSGFGPAPERATRSGRTRWPTRSRRFPDRPRAGFRRRDLRDRHPHRADRVGGAAGTRPGPPGPRGGLRHRLLPGGVLLRPGRIQGDRRGPLRPRRRAGAPRPGAIAGGVVARLRYALPWLALAGGVLFAYSFAGLAWPLAIVALWSLTIPAGAAGAGAALAAALPAAPSDADRPRAPCRDRDPDHAGRPVRVRHRLQQSRRQQHLRPGLPGRVAGGLVVVQLPARRPGRVDPSVAGGGDRRRGPGRRHDLVGTRRDLSVPIAFAACALLYFASLPFTGDYSQAKALMIAAPLAMLIAIRPLLSEIIMRSVRGCGSNLDRSCAGGCWPSPSSAAPPTRASSSCATARSARRGTAPSCGPSCRSCAASPSSTRARTATPPTICSAPTPTCRWSSSPIRRSRRTPKAVRHRRRLQPDRLRLVLRGTLDRFPYVITGRAAWNSEAPPGFRRIAATSSFLLWKRVGKAPEERRVLLEGTNPAALAGCEAPEIRVLLGSSGRACPVPGGCGRAEGALGAPATSCRPGRAPRRRWACPPAAGGYRCSTSRRSS